jgi:hypothetical protein
MVKASKMWHYWCPLSALNEANLTSATQTLKISIPQCIIRLKRHSLVEKLEIKITNLRFASLFVEICSVLTDAQFGFRPGYGTTDAIFSLHSLISKSLRKGKRKLPVFKILLNSLHNAGLIKFLDINIYSFIILSIPIVCPVKITKKG